MKNAIQRIVAGEYSSGQARSLLGCDWKPLREQLLRQWGRLTPESVDHAGPDRRRLARLVERAYGIPADKVENYLRCFERMMPLA